MRSNAYCGNLLWQSSLTRQAPITLASMLRIPVAMHNVPEEQVFQPHCWGLFGAPDDPTGADHRACRNFGPLYATNR